ncbi:MAG: hypothetical protein KDD64_13845 [Bdellovibrionales bacterium]|nr:hypothetical protein [Bdellovibrionales bacterium]
MTFFILVIFLFLSPSTPALATDPAYLVLKDGGEATLRDGYKQLVNAMRDLMKERKESSIVELNLDGNSFFIDVAQIAVLCKEPCRSFEIKKKK